MPRLPIPLRLRAPLLPLRAYSSSSPPKPFANPPSPPKLPAAEQAEFERLQRDAAVSSAFQPGADDAGSQAPSAADGDGDSDGDAAPTPLFRGAAPEFRGDTNPRTGEVGGPKNEPLRWGGGADWSYNGRVTDF